MSNPFIPGLDPRYSSACLEKSARIQARQLVQITFSAMICGLIAVMINNAAFDINKLSQFQFVLLALGVPAFGIIVTAWSGHHDILIGLLDQYCSALEQVGNASRKPGDLIAPNWHSLEAGWIMRGFAARFWSNNAFGFVIICTSIPCALSLYTGGERAFASLLLMVIFVSAVFLRAFMIPQIAKRGIRFKYHCISILLLTGGLICAWCLRHFGEIHNSNSDTIKYRRIVGCFSCLATITAVALLMYFERRRFIIMQGGTYNIDEGRFYIDKNKLKHALPVDIGLLLIVLIWRGGKRLYSSMRR